MAIEVVGRLIQILPEVTGNGKNGAWMKQEFIIETNDMYPKKICISAWGDKVDMLKNYTAGDDLKISVIWSRGNTTAAGILMCAPGKLNGRKFRFRNGFEYSIRSQCEIGKIVAAGSKYPVYCL